MFKKILLLTATILICNSANANFSFSSDSFSVLQGGYRFQFSLEQLGMRFGFFFSRWKDDAEYQSFDGDLKAESKVSGATIDFIGKSSEGMFGGVKFVRTRWIIQNKTSFVSQRRESDYMGLRGGYKYVFWKGFFLMPWASYDINIESNRNVSISGATQEIDDYWLSYNLHIGFQF